MCPYCKDNEQGATCAPQGFGLLENGEVGPRGLDLAEVSLKVLELPKQGGAAVGREEGVALIDEVVLELEVLLVQGVGAGLEVGERGAGPSEEVVEGERGGVELCEPLDLVYLDNGDAHVALEPPLFCCALGEEVIEHSVVKGRRGEVGGEERRSGGLCVRLRRWQPQMGNLCGGHGGRSSRAPDLMLLLFGARGNACIVYSAWKGTRPASVLQIVVVQFARIGRNGPLDLAGVDPRDKVLHVPVRVINQWAETLATLSAPRHEERRVLDRIRSDANMPLLDVLDSLCIANEEDVLGYRPGTHHLDRLGHLEPSHDHRQSSPAEGRDGDLGRELGKPDAGVNEAHVVELGDKLALLLSAEWVLRRELADAVGEGADGAAEPVVSLVVFAVSGIKLRLSESWCNVRTASGCESAGGP
jgi:hypothetical protein